MLRSRLARVAEKTKPTPEEEAEEAGRDLRRTLEQGDAMGRLAGLRALVTPHLGRRVGVRAPP